MNKLIPDLSIIFISSCAVVSLTSQKQQSAKHIIEKCFDEQLARCGDLICEMDLNNHYEIIEQLKINILDCVEGKWN